MGISINLLLLKALSAAQLILRLSQKEYADQGGNECPVCGETDLNYDTFEVEGCFVYQQVSCGCGVLWYDTYELMGYGEVDTDRMESRKSGREDAICPKCNEYWWEHEPDGSCQQVPF